MPINNKGQYKNKKHNETGQRRRKHQNKNHKQEQRTMKAMTDNKQMTNN